MQIDIYVDGSFKDGKVLWGYIVVLNEEIVHSDNGEIIDPAVVEGRQVGGECQAVIEALKYCKQYDHRADIYFDYIGLRAWIADCWDEKPWKTNKVYTKKYRAFCLDHRQYFDNFVKVKSHSGNKWNDEVDKLVGNT